MSRRSNADILAEEETIETEKANEAPPLKPVEKPIEMKAETVKTGMVTIQKKGIAKTIRASDIENWTSSGWKVV